MSGADNPKGQNFNVNRNHLSLRSFATKKSLSSLILYNFFHYFIHVYSLRAGADNPLGMNFDVNGTSCHFGHLLQVLKKISLESDFTSVVVPYCSCCLYLYFGSTIM